jgi:hypothetical protein
VFVSTMTLLGARPKSGEQRSSDPRPKMSKGTSVFFIGGRTRRRRAREDTEQGRDDAEWGARLRGEAWARRAKEDRACDAKSGSSSKDKSGGTKTHTRRHVAYIDRREG